MTELSFVQDRIALYVSEYLADPSWRYKLALFPKPGEMEYPQIVIIKMNCPSPLSPPPHNTHTIS